MNNKKFFLLAAALAVVLILAGAAYRYLSSAYVPDSSEPPAESTGEPAYTETEEPAQETEPEIIEAPDFAAETLDGETVRLSDYEGKPVVINFWATWCGPCKSELPAFENMYAEYGDDVAFMMVNLTDGSRETKESVAAFLDEAGYTFPVFCDTTLMGAQLYGAYSIPLTVFVLPDGTLAGGYRGAINEDLLEEAIQIVLEAS